MSLFTTRLTKILPYLTKRVTEVKIGTIVDMKEGIHASSPSSNRGPMSRSISQSMIEIERKVAEQMVMHNDLHLYMKSKYIFEGKLRMDDVSNWRKTCQNSSWLTRESEQTKVHSEHKNSWKHDFLHLLSEQRKHRT